MKQSGGQSAIITGAGEGVGRACARIMAERGAEVIVLSRTASDLDSLREEIGGRSMHVDLAARAAT
nr:short-chain dehydrogenase [Rhizobium sp. Khangiran2]